MEKNTKLLGNSMAEAFTGVPSEGRDDTRQSLISLASKVNTQNIKVDRK